MSHNRVISIRKRLYDRISEEISQPVEMPSRLYAGINQRALGAWSWAAGNIGSQYSMRECLVAKKWHIRELWDGDVEIIPINERTGRRVGL